MEALSKLDLQNSIRDGVFANMFAALTGGVFLTGFALHLGMNEFMIGFLGAMPFLVTVFQLPAAYFVQRKGNRKRFALWAAGVARGLWIPIMLVAMLPFLSAPLKSAIILGVILLSYASASVSFVSWLSWTADLVPESMRGRFFGTRNMVNGAAGILVVLIFGHLLDFLNHHRDGGQPVGFALTFGAAVLFGLLSLSFLNRISEPELATGDGSYAPFSEHFVIPFKSNTFRRFLWFSFAWSFSVYFASPFFSLYFLRDLRFSYGFVATMAMISAFADLLGMRLWGKISDKVRNKAIIRLASWIAAFLPLLWVTVSPESKVVPIVLHLVGGGLLGWYQPLYEQLAAAHLAARKPAGIPVRLLHRGRAWRGNGFTAGGMAGEMLSRAGNRDVDLDLASTSSHIYIVNCYAVAESAFSQICA